MSEAIDPRTILILTFVVKVFMAGIMMQYWHMQKRYPGLGLWVAAAGCSALVSALYIFRGQIPDLLSIGAANLAAVVALVCQREGFRLFYGRGKMHLIHWLPGFFAWIALLYYFVIVDDIMMRLLIVAALGGVYGIMIAWIALRDAKPWERDPAIWIAFFHVLFVVGLLAKTYAWYRVPEYRQVLDDNWANTFSYSIELISSVGVVFNLMLLNGLRITHELIEKSENLQVEQNRLRRILSVLPIPLSVHAEDGEVIEISDYWMEVTGYVREEISTVGAWIQKAYRANEEEASRENMLSIYGITNKLIDPREHEIVTRSGELRLWLFNHAPLGCLPDGRRTIVSVAVDITYIKQAENKLQQWNEELEKTVRDRTAEWEDLYNNAPCGYHTINADGVITQINNTELGWLGYSREEVVGIRMLEDFLTPMTKPIYQHTLQILRKGENTGDMEYELVSRNGRIRAVLTNSSLVQGSDGNRVMIRCSMFDITDRKQAERSLREREVQLRDFLDNASDPIHMTNADGNFIYVNEAWVRLFGYNREEVKQLTIYDVMHPSERDKQDEISVKQELFPAPVRGEYVFVSKDRQMGYIETVINVRYENGKYAGSQAILIDVTARREMENALRDSSARLSLANQEFERAMRAKNEFLAGMSHELRTPLTAVIGLSEVLREGAYGALDRQQRDAVEIIEKSGRHLLELINDILDLSKLESKQVELEIEDCSASDIVQTSLQFIKTQAKKKNLELIIDIVPEQIGLQADPRRLKQILLNLLINAVKFTPAGGKIGLSVQADEKAKTVSFTVWDTGIGIHEKDFAKLFQPFVQIDSSLSRHYTGTGLGLVLVQRSARMHGGDVSVKSSPGKGSRFTVWIPWRKIGKKDGRPTTDKEHGLHIPILHRAVECNSSPLPAATASEKPLVIIAEDIPDNVKVILGYLREQPWQFVVVDNGTQAVQQARALHPNLILMDVQMPEMDGLAATRIIRDDEDSIVARIPIIALSALAMTGDRERCFEAGANDYVSKPISCQELIQKMERWINKVGEEIV